MLCNVALDSPTTSSNLEILMLSFPQAAYFDNKLVRLMVRAGLTPFDTIALSFFCSLSVRVMLYFCFDIADCN